MSASKIEKNYREAHGASGSKQNRKRKKLRRLLSRQNW